MATININEIQIDEELRLLLPPPSKEELDLLKKDILKNGVISPLVLWNYKLIDGHNRYQICKENGIDVLPVKYIEFGSKQNAKLWMLQQQLGRRNLTDFQKNEIALKYRKEVAEAAKERKMSGTKITLGSNVPKVNKGKTSEILGEIAGTNHTSINRTNFILNNGTPEQIERARGGEPMSRIEKEIKEENTQTKKCIDCGMILPLDNFYVCRGVRRNMCKNCFNGRIAEAKGHAIPEEFVADEFRADNKKIVFCHDDAVEEVRAKAKDLSFSVARMIEKYKDVISRNEIIAIFDGTFRAELAKE